MPFIILKMTEGRTMEQKRALMKAYAQATIDILKVDPQKIKMVIDEYSDENWANAGVPLCDTENK